MSSDTMKKRYDAPMLSVRKVTVKDVIVTSDPIDISIGGEGPLDARRRSSQWDDYESN